LGGRKHRTNGAPATTQAKTIWLEKTGFLWAMKNTAMGQNARPPAVGKLVGRKTQVPERVLKVPAWANGWEKDLLRRAQPGSCNPP